MPKSSNRRTKQASTEKPEHQLKCFVSSSFAGRIDEVGRVLEEHVSPTVYQLTSSRSVFRHAFRIEWNRLDLAPFSRSTIQQNVFAAIQLSHFCVADITPEFKEIAQRKAPCLEAPNPSVMHEVGYAHGLDIPVFLIGEAGTAQHLPANLRGSLVGQYKTKDLQASSPTNFSKTLSETIADHIQQAGAPLPPGEFRVDGYRLRHEVDLPYMIRNAQHRVFILTTNLEYIVKRLRTAIKYSLEKNIKGTPPANPSFKIDMLTMDPESIVTNARAKQINLNVEEFRNDLRSYLAEMRCFKKLYDQNMHINTYVSLPTLILFVIDNVVVWSVPFPSQQSRMVPHFVVSHDDVTIEQFVLYFFSVKSQATSQTLI